jgi:hypothetical protein
MQHSSAADGESKDHVVRQRPHLGLGVARMSGKRQLPKGVMT